jgi:hypothetical protein
MLTWPATTLKTAGTEETAVRWREGVLYRGLPLISASWDLTLQAETDMTIA